MIGMIAYMLPGAAIAATIAACFTHNEKMEKLTGEKLTIVQDIKFAVANQRPERHATVALLLAVTCIGGAAALLLFWPLLLLNALIGGEK